MNYAQRLTEVLKEIGAPATSANSAYKNAIFVINAELQHLQSQVWDRRNSPERYQEYRTRYYAYLDILDALLALKNLANGIKPFERPIPTARVAETGYDEL